MEMICLWELRNLHTGCSVGFCTSMFLQFCARKSEDISYKCKKSFLQNVEGYRGGKVRKTRENQEAAYYPIRPLVDGL